MNFLMILDSIKNYILSNGGMLASVLGFVLVFVAKVFPNANAGFWISKIQAFVDMGSKLLQKVGDLLHALSDFLASLIQSDGFLGKK